MRRTPCTGCLGLRVRVRVRAVVVLPFNRMEMTFLYATFFVTRHSVLKWLQKPLLKPLLTL